MTKIKRFFEPGFYRRFQYSLPNRRWVPPHRVPDPFFHAKDINAVHDFFADSTNSPDSDWGSAAELPGQCFICSEPVNFLIERPAKDVPVNWRETLRCPRCNLINRWRACIHLFHAVCKPSPEHRIYLTEKLSPVYQQLVKQYPSLSSSEYLPQAEPGEQIDVGNMLVRNEDITSLTFKNSSFDALLCFDVLEHVPDYTLAIDEFYRVLASGGQAIISVPFSFRNETTVRAVVDKDGQINHLLEPSYHGDPLSPDGVLSFYDFGMDLLSKMRTAGFRESFLLCYRSAHWGYLSENVAFVARK